MANYYLIHEQEKRLNDLQRVWQHLYENKQFNLCGIISKEIATIKEYKF